MKLLNFTSLLTLYTLSLMCIMFLIYQDFKHIRFNFNIFFSFLYLTTFYFGLPITVVFFNIHDTQIVSINNLLKVLITVIIFYVIYYITYKNILVAKNYHSCVSRFAINNVEIYLFWLLLLCISIVTFVIFFIQNGCLLFILHDYNQIYSDNICNVSLKRFFYFFVPAMLLFYLLNPNYRNWLIFFITTLTFGVCTYIVTGGTRANIIIAYIIFLLIGIQHKWIKIWISIILNIILIISMSWLAMERSGLNIHDNNILYILFNFTKDTFFPWENLALLIQQYNHIDFQGISPIFRDFYVFIPKYLWLQHPSFIGNTANYFTQKILNNHSGISISPTIIGSLIIMGGIYSVPLGAIIVGFIIKILDVIYMMSKMISDHYISLLLELFCFSTTFNIIIMVREGLDAFISHMMFFCLIFGLCLLLVKLFYLLTQHINIINTYYIKLINLLK